MNGGRKGAVGSEIYHEDALRLLRTLHHANLRPAFIREVLSLQKAAAILHT